ncbi:uncharacterized protein BXZ73DRAFT_48447 [Epithele typhae]|uniref:uncharacterized protein n=1 Tax=Epithele typhae TaxID=378194 RepID=UPI0020087290|nr:uncharacterized protein BXZ73DRAFT_48447 [Epithele typhae]KAH9928546.1 hypothetical protein BXZ73DRAFT_48447 [Epithele typhae]
MASSLDSPPPYDLAALPGPSQPPCPSLFSSFKQSISQLATSSSRFDIEVLPFDSVDMYGAPNKSSAYSLSGQIVVTLTPPSGFFGDAPAADEHLLLDSLVVAFEGQSELVHTHTGYSACRLHESSQELITSPIEIRHSWTQGSSRDPARWFILFSVALPGWLPATSSTPFGDGSHLEPEVSYHLSAVAKYHDAKPNSSWRSAYYGSAHAVVQVARAKSTPVKINRYSLPPSTRHVGDEFPDTMFPSIEYACSITENSRCTIPRDIIKKLELRTSVPEHISVDAESFPLLIKLRPGEMSMEERRRLRLPGFTLLATQNETLRASTSSAFAAAWPIPPAASQPPHRPLTRQRADSGDYECGMICSPPADATVFPSYSLHPTGFTGKYEFNEREAECASFADPRFDDDDDVWVRLRINVPIRSLFVSDPECPRSAHQRLPVLRPTTNGPLRSVSHALDLALTVVYDHPDGPVVDELRLVIPLSFVRVPRVCAPRTSSGSANVTSPLGAHMAQALPPYHALFYANGTQKEDPMPLPRYTPKGHPPDEPEVEAAPLPSPSVDSPPISTFSKLPSSPAPPSEPQLSVSL